MSKEAMKLALEALENSVDLVREDAYNAEKLYGNYPSRQGKVRGLKVLADDHEKAITAIKQALAAPVYVKTFHGGKPWPLHPAPVQEPVAWVLTAELDKRETTTRAHLWFSDPVNCLWTPIYTTPPATPVQEPMAFFDWYGNAHWGNEDFKEGCHRSWNAAIKYTTPPAAQRQWVGLTQQDIDIAFDDTQEGGGFDEFARAIEAKLKEKNGGVV
jgi:hypothetical protein